MEADVPVPQGAVLPSVCMCVFIGEHAQGRVLVTGYGCSRKLETCTSLSRGQVSLSVSLFSYIPDDDDNTHPVCVRGGSAFCKVP